jgi:hypothetical protein
VPPQARQTEAQQTFDELFPEGNIELSKFGPSSVVFTGEGTFLQ